MARLIICAVIGSTPFFATKLSMLIEGIMKKGHKVGDRVQIVRKDISGLKHRHKRGKVFGIITIRENADNFLVRPMWCTWETHLYSTEIRGT